MEMVPPVPLQGPPTMGMYPIQGQPGAQTTVITTTTAPGVMGVGMSGQPPVWMVRPAPIPGCPPGLEYLTHLDQLWVQQQAELLEAITGFEQANKYRVFNNQLHQCYFAFEESSNCMRLCCGTHREFVIHIVDNLNQEVMRIFRPYKCCATAGCCGCSECCNFEICVEAPVGVPIGYAMSQWYCCSPHWVILDANRTPKLSVDGPCSMGCPCCCEIDFNIKSLANDDVVGKITKQWSGFAMEAFTDADNFGVSFAQNLDVHQKASIFGLLFLIDFMFFEQNGNGRKRTT